MGKYGDVVYAAAVGAVSFTGYAASLGGLMIYIKHEGGWETRYMHLMDSSVSVSAGQKVVQGQPLAKVGCTEISSCPASSPVGAHLHFEVLKDGVRLDPERVLGGVGLFGWLVIGSLGYLAWKWIKKRI